MQFTWLCESQVSYWSYICQNKKDRRPACRYSTHMKSWVMVCDPLARALNSTPVKSTSLGYFHSISFPGATKHVVLHAFNKLLFIVESCEKIIMHQCYLHQKEIKMYSIYIYMMSYTREKGRSLDDQTSDTNATWFKPRTEPPLRNIRP